MSGPKYSDYVLERQRLLIIKAQLEAELERNQCEQIIKDINACIKKSDLYCSQTDIEKYEENISAAEEIIQSPIIGELKKLIAELKVNITEEYAIKGNSAALISVLNSYKKRLKKIKNLALRIDDLMRDLNIQYNKQRQENREIEFENAQWDTPITSSNISEDLITVYSNIIEQLMDGENFQEEKAKYDAILHNHLFDDNYKISQMKMNYDSYLVEKQSENDNMAALNLRSEYIALSNLIYGECLEVPDDIACMKKDIEEMLIEAQRQKVGEYVADCINKVMSDLGYEIAGSEVLSTQKITKHHYEYSSDSAITVASSETGAMMLEVVGKKNADGTHGSTAAVKADMERFCPDYKKIKQGLQEYGISLTDKKLCPPDEKYVKFVDIGKHSSENRRITVKNRKKIMYNE